MLEPLFTDVFRFRIAVALFRNELNYTTLKNELSATDGNISFHLKKLEKSWIISISKVLDWKKASTIISLTEDWRKRLFEHLYELESIVKEIK